jgi:hypothetical protein
MVQVRIRNRSRDRDTALLSGNSSVDTSGEVTENRMTSPRRGATSPKSKSMVMDETNDNMMDGDEE